MEDEAFSIWTPHQAFYIQSMLFNTASAFQSCNIAEKIIQKISDGKIDPQEKKDYYWTACRTSSTSLELYRDTSSRRVMV